MKNLAFLLLTTLLLLIIEEQSRLASKLDRKLNALQRRLAAIAEHLNVKVTAGLPQAVADLARAGRKIEAIKAYRVETSAGLAEAKDAVERFMAEGPNPRDPAV